MSIFALRMLISRFNNHQVISLFVDLETHIGPSVIQNTFSVLASIYVVHDIPIIEHWVIYSKADAVVEGRPVHFNDVKGRTVGNGIEPAIMDVECYLSPDIVACEVF